LFRRFAALSSALVFIGLAGCEATTLEANLPQWLGGADAAGPTAATEPPTEIARIDLPPPPPEPVTEPEPPIEPPPTPRAAQPIQPKPVEPVIVEPAPPVLTAPEAGPTAVAILLPLSGRYAGLGELMLDAAQLALFDVADEGIVLRPYDTAGTEAGAVRASEAAISEGAAMVLGPVFNATANAAAPAARERGINVVAFSNDRSVAGNGVFLMGFMPEQQIERAVAFARTQGISRFAALVPETDYGAAIVEALRGAAVRNESRVVRVEHYPAGAAEIDLQVRRLAHYDQRQAALRARRPAAGSVADSETAAGAASAIGRLDYDAVILPEGGPSLRAIAALLPYYDIDPKAIRFIGTYLWYEPDLGREPALVGGWYAGPPPAQKEAFRQRFAKAYGREPQAIASIAYDAVALAAALAKQGDFSAQAILSPNGFAGIDGIFRFNRDGTAERGLAVIEVTSLGFRVVSNAPETFQTLSY
jgi:branched-chain amino acid transport system substrate-binding protein